LKEIVASGSISDNVSFMTNDFALIGDDMVGKLATIGFEEIFDKSVDGGETPVIFVDMTKEQYKEQQRQKRIEANSGFGLKLAKIMKGEVTPTFNNSAVWDMQRQIAGEIAPVIRKRQLAWAGDSQR